MAEGFEPPYHVPQQTRRDKLRVLNHHHQHHSVAAAAAECIVDDNQSNNNLHHFSNLYDDQSSDLLDSGKAASFMAESNSNSANFTNFTSNMFLDPRSSNVSVHLNPNFSRNPFLYPAHNTKLFLEDSFHVGEVNLEPLSVSGNRGHGQGLSLTLSSNHTNRSNTSLPLELDLQRYDSSMTSAEFLVSSIHGGGDGGAVVAGTNFNNDNNNNSNSNNNNNNNDDCDLSRGCSVPGPFTGYASILKGSRFLKPAQMLLEEVCDVVRGVYGDDDCDYEKLQLEPDSALMDLDTNCSGFVDDSQSSNDGVEHRRRKKSRLISMLDEVYRRYKQYYQQLQAVVASFESVAGLNNAAPFANLALKAMSKHFRCLKDAITEQLQFAGRSQGHMSFEGEASPSVENLGKGIYFQSTANRNAALMEHQQPVWRPQRGLPERAVTVLRAWLFDHFLHPYPTDTDKIMLAKQTGLSRNQVSNWFINARVRLWKPMVEEIHNLETRQGQKGTSSSSQTKERNNKNDVTCEDASTSMHPPIQELPSKRTRNEPESSMGSDEPMEISYNNLSHQTRLGITSSNVSLTLGLHRNNELGLSSSFPVNAAQRFGLDSSNEGFVLSGFEAHNAQFGRDMIG